MQDFKRVQEEYTAFDPQLVIMDIILPFYNGFHWCTQIRQISSVPILFLSSASDNMNIVMAMNMGGDDFVEKPFDLNVLTAKIQALLRRAYSFTGQLNVLEYRDVILNLNDAAVTFHGERMELTKNDFKILQILMENAGKIVKRDRIMERLWESDEFIDDNTLTVNMTRLRKKLESIGICDFIATKKGIGYVIRMRLLISYLKEKLPVIGVYAVMLVIFCILLWLKEVPFDVIGYGAELSAIWLLFVGALNFWFYRKRYQSLLDLSAALPHELKEFPDPKSRIEAEYQEITETIFAWREMLENEVLLSKKDASDYYSLWVHQIKTPISAMHLLIQSFEEQAMEFEEHAEETLDFLNEMKMKIFQTEEYVGMVLSYLRMEDMGNDLKFQWYPIGDIMRQAVRKYSQIFILKKIHLNFQDSRQMVLTE